MNTSPLLISLNVGEILSILLVGYKVLRLLSKITDAFENFPPHRHINGTIIYPKEFTPSRVERVDFNASKTT